MRLFLAQFFVNLIIAQNIGCTGGDLIFFVEEPLSFANALESCQENGASLARITSTEENNIAFQLREGKQVLTWIGVDSLELDILATDDALAENFDWTDNTQEGQEFFREEAGEFPWDSSQPDNGDSDELVEQCVAMSVDSELWRDRVCEEVLSYFCRQQNAVECTEGEEGIDLIFVGAVGGAALMTIIIIILAIVVVTNRKRNRDYKIHVIGSPGSGGIQGIPAPKYEVSLFGDNKSIASSEYSVDSTGVGIKGFYRLQNPATPGRGHDSISLSLSTASRDRSANISRPERFSKDTEDYINEI